LALSACLVFCAALADLSQRRVSPWLCCLLLFSAQLLAGGVRLEKNAVMLATACATALFFAWAGRRGWGRAGVARRGLVGLALSAAAFVAVQAGQSWAHPGGWSMGSALPRIVAQRIVYPHMEDIYDDLPARARERVDRSQAIRFDKGILNAIRVWADVTRGNSQIERELALDLAWTTVRERGALLALDVIKDTGENVFASLSFYVRVCAFEVLSRREWRARFSGGGGMGDLKALLESSPRLVGTQLVISAVLLVFAGGAALAGWRSSPRRSVSATHSGFSLAWLPVGVFWILNSAAFAFTQDLLLVRYALLSHVILLQVVGFGAVLWIVDTTEDKHHMV
jgi:hypothetical protein